MCLSDRIQSASDDKAEGIESVATAIDMLCDELREAKLLFESGCDTGREGAIHAVEALTKFLMLSETVRREGLIAPLGVLLSALMSLDDGATQPILRRRPRRGRSRASAMRDCDIGAAAFTVSRLKELGMHDSDANKLVARRLTKIGVKASRGRNQTITERTVKGWCEAVSADFGRTGEAAVTFDLLRDLPQAGSTADYYLDRLERVILKTRGQERR
jgi:hypothetical protein